MAKKATVLIEYRFDKMDAWTEYARTTVPAIVSLYYLNCQQEFKSAEVRIRNLVP